MNIEMVQEEVVDNAIKQMENLKQVRFTQVDSARFRAAFKSFTSSISDTRHILECIKLQDKGKFMDIIITRNEENVSTLNSSFTAFAVLDTALVKAFSSRGWKLIKASAMREEGEIIRFHIRIEKLN